MIFFVLMKKGTFAILLYLLCQLVYAGRIQLALEEISIQEFQQAKEIISSIDYLDFDDLNNCENRAHWMMFELAANNINSSTIYISGALINSWNYHMATVVSVENRTMVFDRSFEADPMPLERWIAAVTFSDHYHVRANDPKELSVVIVNHFCSILENPRGTKRIHSFDDLSPHAKELFQAMDSFERIGYYWASPEMPIPFNCQNYSLEYQ